MSSIRIISGDALGGSIVLKSAVKNKLEHKYHAEYMQTKYCFMYKFLGCNSMYFYIVPAEQCTQNEEFNAADLPECRV